jgi:TPR repeat protein
MIGQFYLGICYRNGYGCSTSRKKSVEYFNLASNLSDLKKGNACAQYYLGFFRFKFF